MLISSALYRRRVFPGGAVDTRFRNAAVLAVRVVEHRGEYRCAVTVEIMSLRRDELLGSDFM